MILRLICPKCVYEAAKKQLSSASVSVPSPISRIADDGKYEVKCALGHESIVFVDNVKFELLFELGVNSLVDGYPREAVSSFTAALERFYEFYWRVVMCHLAISFEEIDKTWKSISKQSERQLGAFVTAHFALMNTSPKLLNTNQEVKFRNQVIHDGYVPKIEEAISYGNTVMHLINQALNGLRENAFAAVEATYKRMSPAPIYDENYVDENPSEIRGTVNILTTIDVRNPPFGDDQRVGDIKSQFKRILYERQPFGLETLSKKEFKKRFPKGK